VVISYLFLLEQLRELYRNVRDNQGKWERCDLDGGGKDVYYQCVEKGGRFVLQEALTDALAAAIVITGRSMGCPSCHCFNIEEAVTAAR
jgi:hypothetical protein